MRVRGIPTFSTSMIYLPTTITTTLYLLYRYHYLAAFHVYCYMYAIQYYYYLVFHQEHDIKDQCWIDYATYSGDQCPMGTMCYTSGLLNGATSTNLQSAVNF